MDSPTDPVHGGGRRNRKRAAIAVVPLLTIGVIDLLLLLEFGLDPLWGFAILPPMIMISVFGWIYFGAVDEDERHVEETQDQTRRN